MILYFSGTGNSAYVAEKLAEQTGDNIVNLHEFIKSHAHEPLHSDKPWVIVVPTYAWQIPHIVSDWLLETELSGSKDAYFVMTCGDSIGNAGKYNQAFCLQKQWNYRGTAKVIMPENYIAMFDAPDLETSKRIISAASRSIRKTGEYILQGGNLPKGKVRFIDKILSGPVNAGFNRYYMKSTKFYVKDTCTRCGLCEKLCPMNNIKAKNVKPVWGKTCTHCMACICHCPAESIEYGKTSVGKVRYTCPKE